MVYLSLLSSKNSIMAFIAQTAPAVNIPSKKIAGNQCIPYDVVNPPKKIDIKKPTQVDVHKVQLIKSPKNFDFVLIHCRWFSKMEPQTKIDVIPYPMNDHKIIDAI